MEVIPYAFIKKVSSNLLYVFVLLPRYCMMFILSGRFSLGCGLFFSGCGLAHVYVHTAATKSNN